MEIQALSSYGPGPLSVLTNNLFRHDVCVTCITQDNEDTCIYPPFLTRL